MDNLITTQNITFTLGVLGVIFGVYKHFKNPQIDLDKQQAVTKEEVDGKAALLRQQVQIKADETDRRFTEMGKKIEDAFLLAANHTHTIEVKVDGLTATIITMSNNLTRLQTIMEERLPESK